MTAKTATISRVAPANCRFGAKCDGAMALFKIVSLKLPFATGGVS